MNTPNLQVNELKSKVGFYVGDPCYVMERSAYDEMLGDTMVDGEKTVRGHRCVFASTAYGDGCYDGFCVDAGIIGCIPFELLDTTPEEIEEEGLGRFIKGDTANFECSDDGDFYVEILDDGCVMDEIYISTGDDEDPFELDWPEDDEEEDETEE